MRKSLCPHTGERWSLVSPHQCLHLLGRASSQLKGQELKAYNSRTALAPSPTNRGKGHILRGNGDFRLCVLLHFLQVAPFLANETPHKVVMGQDLQRNLISPWGNKNKRTRDPRVSFQDGMNMLWKIMKVKSWEIVQWVEYMPSTGMEPDLICGTTLFASAWMDLVN